MYTIVESLSSRVQALLERFSSTVPPYTPDYSGFMDELGSILKPVLEYADAEFHRGHPEECQLALLSFRKLAELKWNIGQEWKVAIERLGPNHPQAVQYYCYFKLLTYFFGQPWKDMVALTYYDFEYQLHADNNPERREEILAKLVKCWDATSSAECLHALKEATDGNLTQAISHCDEAIKRMPGNTFAYAIKAEFLQRLAQQVLESGLKQEPRDKRLQCARRLLTKLSSLREEFSEGRVTIDDFADRLVEEVYERSAEGVISPAEFESFVRDMLPNTELLSSLSLTFLSTGECLLRIVPPGLDHAPAAIEFCKAVEVEVERIVFQQFVAQISKASQGGFVETEYNRKLLAYCFRKKPLTLGDMGFLFQISNSRKKVASDDLLRLFSQFFGSHQSCATDERGVSLLTLLTPDNVDRYRNSAAHDAAYPLSKAKAAAMWCYSILKQLTSPLNVVSP